MDILSLIQTSQPVVVEIGDRKTVCGLAGGVPVQVETSLRGRGGRILNLRDLTDCRTVSIYRDEWRDAVYDFLQELLFARAVIIPKERTIILVESIVFPTLLNEIIAEILFTKFSVPKVVVIPSQPASVFATGQTTAMVVDCGFHESFVVPVVNRLVLTHCMQTIATGTKRIHEKLLDVLRSHPSVYRTLQERGQNDSVEWAPLSQNLSSVALDTITRCICTCPSQNVPSPSDEDYWHYQAETIRLRIGKQHVPTISLAAFEPDEEGRTLASTILQVFQSVRCSGGAVNLLGLTYVLRQLNTDLRKELCGKILLTGELVSMPGFAVRLLEEIDRALNLPRFSSIKHMSGKFAILEHAFQPDELAWVGGSVIGSSDQLLASAGVSREAYLEKKGLVPDWTSLLERSRLWPPKNT